MKPKPVSLKHRLVVLQSASIAVALLFVAAAGYVTFNAQRDLLAPLTRLERALQLDFEFRSHLAQIVILAQETGKKDHRKSAEFGSVVAVVRADLEEYRRNIISPTENRYLDELVLICEEVIRRATELHASDSDPETTKRQVSQMLAVRDRAAVVLRGLLSEKASRLQTSGEGLRTYTLHVGLLVAILGAVQLLIVFVSRRAITSGIWKPLETLRQMVLQARRGNLDVKGEAPRSVEVGPLIEQFAEMAREVREVRAGLEEKVRERTRQLEETQAQLLEAAKLTAVGRLVAGVAHEVNNPLTSILGFAEVVADSPRLNAKEQHYIHTIREEALRVRKVVANLNAFARQGPQRTHRVDLRTVVDRLVELRHYQLASNKINLHVDVPAAPLWVNGDSDQLTQMMFNILQNAEQAVREWKREGGDIWLAGGQRNGTVWVELRDNGCGMTPAAREHALEPFFTTRPVGEGMGLGLSVAHGIAQQHHGEIQLESAAGRGTALTITLPAAAPIGNGHSNPPEGSPVDDNRGTAFSGEPRALILDDERGILTLVEQVLNRRGFRCTALSNPMEIEPVLDNQFDIVICDLKMPGRSGLEVYDILRERQPRLATRFLLMTGNLADAEEREISELLAASRILRKPFSLAQLSAAVNALMRG